MKAKAIWSPRYWDKKVLINKLDVEPKKCFLFFCCDKNLKNLYSYDGVKVKNECPLRYNGKIYCYEVPLDWLNNEGELPLELEKVRTKEYSKYKNRLNKSK